MLLTNRNTHRCWVAEVTKARVKVMSGGHDNSDKIFW